MKRTPVPGVGSSAVAKSCILIWLDGGPTHFETFDPKPEAPAEIRGEFAIVIAPPAAEDDAPDADAVDALLRRALRHASVKDAVSDVAAATGRPRREIYQRALALSDDQESEDGAEQ